MNTKTKLLIAGAVALFLTGFEPAGADTRIIAGGWSHHLNSGDYNEDHRAVGVHYNGWSAISFTNSYDDPAVGIGREWMGGRRGAFEGGLYVAAWFGYLPDNQAAFIPVVALRGRWNVTERFAVVASTAVAISTLHLEFRL